MTFGKFYVRKEAGRSLDVFSRLLKQQPEFNLIELGAHTDSEVLMHLTRSYLKEGHNLL